MTKFETISHAMNEAVRTEQLTFLMPTLKPEQIAMVMLWCGTDKQVMEGAELMADYLGPGTSVDVPRQWLVDAVLFNSGHREKMKSIPSVAASLAASKNGGSNAITVMWDVGDRLTKQVAAPTWQIARSALRNAGWIK